MTSIHVLEVAFSLYLFVGLVLGLLCDAAAMEENFRNPEYLPTRFHRTLAVLYIMAIGVAVVLTKCAIELKNKSISAMKRKAA